MEIGDPPEIIKLQLNFFFPVSAIACTENVRVWTYTNLERCMLFPHHIRKWNNYWFIQAITFKWKIQRLIFTRLLHKDSWFEWSKKPPILTKFRAKNIYNGFRYQMRNFFMSYRDIKMQGPSMKSQQTLLSYLIGKI